MRLSTTSARPDAKKSIPSQSSEEWSAWRMFNRDNWQTKDFNDGLILLPGQFNYKPGEDSEAQFLDPALHVFKVTGACH